MSQPTRQLAAIMFTDIVGYTTLMGKDEKKALELVQQNIAIQKPLVEQHNGKWLKEMGDGTMAQFNTALDAVNCALDIQKKASIDFEGKLRIGIHSGDITIQNQDVYGDGVNVASRLQDIADPGGIYISDAIEKAVRGLGIIESVDMGEVSLKNVDYGVRTYAIQGKGLPVPKTQTIYEQGSRRSKLIWAILIIITTVIVGGFGLYIYSKQIVKSEPTNKSIAVLPFADMSPDQDQEYFGDGISEEIINVLAKVPQLKVSGRTSSFSYKGKDVTVQEIGNQLGVNSILEGSIRKSGNKIRITAQLINVSDGFHLWTETYNRELNDIFKVQDEITAAIFQELKVRLDLDQKKKVEIPVTDIDAYELYLRARTALSLRGGQLFQARDLFKQVIAIDPDYSPAYSGLGRTLSLLPAWSRVPAREANMEAKEMVEKAIQLDPNNAEALSVKGSILAFYEWKWEEAQVYLEKSFELQPTDTEIANFLGDFYMWVRHPDAEKVERLALELDPMHAVKHVDLSVVYLHSGDYKKSEYHARKCIELGPELVWGYRNLAESFYFLEDLKALDSLDRAFQPLNARDTVIKLEMRLWLAMGQSDVKAQEFLLQDLEKAVKAGIEYPAYLVDFCLKIGNYEKAAVYIEQAYKERDYYLCSQSINPEQYPRVRELDEALSKPELQALFEIRKKNLQRLD